jgi:DNA-binding FadR family transcriptional regulator
MPRKSLVSHVADELLDRIIAGDLEVGKPLPSEAEIGEAYDVSRVTVRESLRVLSTQGIIRVTPGIGSVVSPLAEWQSLGPLLRYRSQRDEDGAVATQLISVRRMFETEAAALAAPRLSESDLEELGLCVDRMRAASEASDLKAFVSDRGAEVSPPAAREPSPIN